MRGLVLLISLRVSCAELAYWTDLRNVLRSSAEPCRSICCGGSESTPEAFLRSHSLVEDYGENKSTNFLHTGDFLDVCESYARYGWAEGVLPCIFGFASSVACIARVGVDFPRYSQDKRDAVGIRILDSVGLVEGRRILSWLAHGSKKHLQQWLSTIAWSSWKGLTLLRASGWPLDLDELRRNGRAAPGPVAAHLLLRLQKIAVRQIDSGREELQRTRPSLESLMYKYHTDKSRDDHKYSDLYAMLFEPLRDTLQNLTEIGVMAGYSLKVWHDYFPHATVFGVDTFDFFKRAEVATSMKSHPRAHLFESDSQSDSSIKALGLSVGSMDIIIDDADHSFRGQERTLHVMWRFLRAGGYYIIEDVEWDREGDHRIYPMSQRPHKLHRKTQDILRRSDAFFADNTVGHRAFDLWAERVAVWSPFPHYHSMNRTSHSSHMLVIRKRIEPLPPCSLEVDYLGMSSLNKSQLTFEL